MRWLTLRNPAQRPSAVEVLRSELLPPSVADEQLTDLLRSIPERCENPFGFQSCMSAHRLLPCHAQHQRALEQRPLITDSMQSASNTTPVNFAHPCLWLCSPETAERVVDALFALPADVGAPLDEVAGAPVVLPGQVNTMAFVSSVRTPKRFTREQCIGMSKCALAPAV